MDQLRIMGRATQGVRLIKVGEGDEISSVEKISREDEELSEIVDSLIDTPETLSPSDSPESAETPEQSPE